MSGKNTGYHLLFKPSLFSDVEATCNILNNYLVSENKEGF